MPFKNPVFNIEIRPTALIGSLLLLIGFTVLAFYTLSLPLVLSLVWGLVAVLLYWLSETLHQYGHALAAQRTGYPMIGVRWWWFWSASLYPADEPTLPAAVHRRRALGGAPMSIAFGLLVGVVALLLRETLSAPLWGLLMLVVFLNVVYFGLGAFLPLSFTDGGTLLYYRNKP